MALQTSGAITLSDIQTEFGGSNPISLSEYYGAAAGVPASGPISLGDFYGKSSIFTFTISANITQSNLRTLAIAAGWDQSSKVEATIAAGVYVYSTNTATAALTINGSWPGGVTLINNGYIMGKGGKGAGTIGAAGSQTIVAATAGGHAISLGVSCIIDNNSYILGGGGGGAMAGETLNAASNISGGGGAGGGASGSSSDSYPSASGGGPGSYGATGADYLRGGGGGRVPNATDITRSIVHNSNHKASSTGGGIVAGSYAYTIVGNSGGNTWSSSASGLGGSGGGSGAVEVSDTAYGNARSIRASGGGGGWGSAGGNAIVASNYGTNVYTNKGVGGKAVNLNGHTVTWQSTGIRRGAIS